MNVFRRAVITALLALSMALSATVALAQSTTSTLRVRVVSAGGETLAGVSVTIEHVPTGRVFDRVTNSAGVFSAQGLQVGGPYVVRLTDQQRALRDAPSSFDNVFLKLDETESLVLFASTDIEEIVVTGQRTQAPLRIGAGRDFSLSQIQAVPSLSRDFVDMLATDSKILVDYSVPRGPAVSIAGQNFRFNSITIDGVAQNDNFGLSFNASATQRSPISIDAIAGINVNVAPFDVTYGNFLGILDYYLTYFI